MAVPGDAFEHRLEHVDRDQLGPRRSTSPGEQQPCRTVPPETAVSPSPCRIERCRSRAAAGSAGQDEWVEADAQPSGRLAVGNVHTRRCDRAWQDHGWRRWFCAIEFGRERRTRSGDSSPGPAEAAGLEQLVTRLVDRCARRDGRTAPVPRGPSGRPEEGGAPRSERRGPDVAIERNGPRISAGASGLGSNVSSWLGPPTSRSRMTERSDLVTDEPGAPSPPSDRPHAPSPMPPARRKSRRVTWMQARELSRPTVRMELLPIRSLASRSS